MGAFNLIEEQKSQPRITSEGVSKGVSEGVNEQEKILLELLGSHLGKRTPYYAEQMQTPRKNVERWLKPLRDDKRVEFKGSPRTGGYWLSD